MENRIQVTDWMRCHPWNAPVWKPEKLEKPGKLDAGNLRERLLAAGFTDEEYARLHAPIGLAIGAQTPEEIAVSVAAEMIAVRAGLENGLRRPLG